MASSCINTNDAGRPKVFSGKEEDFQPWAKKMEAFFGGKIKESAMMLEWAADHSAEITTELINREFLPTTTNQERGVQNLEFILQQMYTIFWTSRVAKQTTWLTTRGRTHWRRGSDYRNDMISPPEEGKGISFAESFLLDALSQKLQAGLERWESYVGRYEKMKGKMNDEIKLAGLEALVPKSQLQSFENFRGCALEDRDVRGGEVWSENS